MKEQPITILNTHSKFAGFTLVEMAIVLAIVALLLGSLLPTISSQIEQQRRTETRKYMDEVRDALLGYAVSNGHLPCPDITNDGVEDIAVAVITNDVPSIGQSTGKFSCSASLGVGQIPYNTLGVSPKDSYNSTLIYAVTPVFGERNEVYSATNGGGTPLSSSSFNLNSAGTIHVCTAAATPTTNPCTADLTSIATAVIISRGANWATPTTPTLGDETENTDGDSDFVSHDFVQNGFDDLVVWLSPNTLFNRMVAAGKLP